MTQPATPTPPAVPHGSPTIAVDFPLAEVDIVTPDGTRYRIAVTGNSLDVRNPDGRPLFITPEASNVVRITAPTFKTRREVFGA